jgi:hypothetical protein
VKLRWWREGIYIVLVYGVYSTVRNMFGSAGGPDLQSNGIAYGHALDVMEIQDWMHLLFEDHLQRWYLDLPANGFIEFWNIFYGVAHFVVTAVALIWLFRRDPERYPRWRNSLAFTTLVALVGFASFSLMPPRLLDEPHERFGPPPGAEAPPATFVDTLAEYPTVWSFDSGTLKNISNQYAAMPSLHVGWSLWAAVVMWPMVRRRGARLLVVLHPIATIFCIVVTGNHYWLDAAGGALIFGVGTWAGFRVASFWRELRARDSRTSPPPPHEPPREEPAMT